MIYISRHVKTSYLEQKSVLHHRSHQHTSDVREPSAQLSSAAVNLNKLSFFTATTAGSDFYFYFVRPVNPRC